MLDVQEVARLVDGSLECFGEILGGEGVVARNGCSGRRERHGVGHVCVDWIWVVDGERTRWVATAVEVL